MSQDGQPTENPSRKQEKPAQEGAQGCAGVREGHALQGGQSGAESTASQCGRIIYVENAYKINNPLKLVCTTTQDIATFLRESYGFPNNTIGVLFSTARSGTIHRTYFTGTLPLSLDTVFVRLVLLKHPVV